MAKDLADLTVSDVTGFPLTVTLKVQDADANVPGVIGGTLQVPGMAAQSDGSFELTGTAEQINALLAQASFTAHATGQAYIQLTVSNPQSMQASTGIYALTSVTEPVNQAPSFAPPTGTGKLIVSISGSMDYGRSLALLPDGKLVLAGYSYIGTQNYISLIRLNTDGTLDSSFSADGKLLLPSDAGKSNGIYGMGLQPDGKMVLIGNTNGGKSDGTYFLMRLGADGTVDTDFNGTGTHYINIGNGEDGGHAVAIQPDGKILAAGTSVRNGNYDFSLARLNADGSLDTSFGTDGTVVVPVGSYRDLGLGVTLQPDGKIIMVGTAQTVNGAIWNFGIIRLNPDGSLDSSFNGAGKQQVSFGGTSDDAWNVAVQADGKIVVSGLSGGEFGIARLNADGSMDASFGAGGKQYFYVGGGEAESHSLILQPDGKIVMAGMARNGSNSLDFALMRLNPNGSPDTSFNANGPVPGQLLARVGNDADLGYSAVLQPDGKIVVAGYSSHGGTTQFSLIRVNPNGTLDATFNPSASPVDTLAGSAASYDQTGTPVVLDADAAIFDPELAAQGHYSGASITLARVGGAVAEDEFGASGNLSLSNGRAKLHGTDIGSYVQAHGSFTLTLNASATQSRVNEALQSLTYRNTGGNPPVSVDIEWTFNDGNTADAQGRGGALSAAGRTTVSIAPANQPPTGAITITGTAMQGQTLAADTSTLADADGLGAFNYQWLRDGLAIAGATANTYTLAQDDVGFAISLRVSYSDGRGTQETVASASTGAVLPPPANNPPTGLLVITGTAMQGQTLTADTSTLADADGLGAFNYQWLRDGLAIAGATANTYTLAQDDVGFAISLCVSYSDGAGYPEKVLSATTARVEAAQEQPPVVPPNQAPLLLDLPGEIQEVEVGIAAALADWRVVDPDAPHEPLILVLTPVNGHIGGLESASATGIDAIWTQNAWVLQGPALAMNKLLAGLTFTADSPGEAAIEIRLSDGRSPAPVSARYTFRSQDDADGITAAQESGVPGLPGPGGVPALPGDGNGDGILDSRQKEVASAPFAQSPYGGSAPGDAPRTYVTLVAGEGRSVDTASQITGLRQLDSPPGLPGLMELPLGMLAFSLQMDATGGTHRFSLYLDAAQPVNGYWAQNHDGVWTHLASAAFGGRMVIEGDRLRLDFQITDGGEFDADGQLNGVITHQGAAGRLPLSLVGYAPDTEHMLLWF
ncbi:choice-of-anchor U domain-containing protein [Comamonas granuli]|uniref:choice-of-anchor U domain-containing protein n=1 Tax=Comamonas granuli TaxID=290309 RepID=UPI00146FCE4F|nr:choice-of-anchor U domain-containing protein [Comamonas granuli]